MGKSNATISVARADGAGSRTGITPPQLPGHGTALAPPCSRGFPQALAEVRPTESLSATRERYGLCEHVVTDTALEQVRHARNTERIRSGKNTDRI